MARVTAVIVASSLAALALTPALLHTAAQQTPARPSSMPEPKSTIVPHIAANVKIDGVLDEGPWQKAARLTPLVAHDTMAAARVSTEVRIFYDEAAIYLGWICQDTDIQA